MFATTSSPGKSALQVPTPFDAAAVGQYLRLLRHGAGLTQSDLALRLGTTQSAVARLEAGHQRLSLAALQRATTGFGCDVAVVISKHKGAV